MDCAARSSAEKPSQVSRSGLVQGKDTDFLSQGLAEQPGAGCRPCSRSLLHYQVELTYMLPLEPIGSSHEGPDGKDLVKWA